MERNEKNFKVKDSRIRNETYEKTKEKRKEKTLTVKKY